NGGDKVGVAAPADPAARHDEAGVRGIQVGKLLAGVGVVDDGALGHFQHQVGPVLAEHIFAAAVAAALGLVFALVVEIQQRGEVRVYLQEDAAAVPAVAAIGAAVGHLLLAAKGDHAVAAVARLHLNLGFIYKLHFAHQPSWAWMRRFYGSAF